jgi:hypothetical protein
MRWISSFFGVLVGIGILVIAARFLGMEDIIRRAIEAGSLLDWLMGTFAFLWLLLILKAPWDLYFEAHSVAFEQQRSRERGIQLTAGRENYIAVVRQRLLLLAVGAHVFSAALVAGVTYFTHGVVGYYFAAFYLVSTLFRPTIAGYVYLLRKLKALGEESRYPREDVLEMRMRLDAQENLTRDLRADIERMERQATEQEGAHETQIRELRQRLHMLGREFETTASRLTDNQEVIKGIQAFVRLISQSARPEPE